MTNKELIARFILDDCRDDMDLFQRVILGGSPLWSGASRGVQGQKEWADLLSQYCELVLVTGNNLGKSIFTHVAAVHWACTRPGSIVVVFAPSLSTIIENTWHGISRILEKSRVPLGAKIRQGGNIRPFISFPNGSRILGIAAEREENCSGFHDPNLFVILEEASGLKQHVFNALGGLGPRKTLIVGNPLSTDGGFYQRYQLGLDHARKNFPAPMATRSVSIASTESPHSHLDHSPWGIADRTFLLRKKEEEGENSHWYRTHILAQWPSETAENLIDPSLLDYAKSEVCRIAVEAYRKRATSNPIVVACDVGLGVGKSKSVIVVRDNYGFLEILSSDSWTIEETAAEIARIKAEYCLYDSAIITDENGDVGKRLKEALKNQGVSNSWGYFGGDKSEAMWGRSYLNARSATAYTFARRLERGYYQDLDLGTPFHIPADIPNLKDIEEELRGLRGAHRGDGKSALEDKEDFKKRLKRSPDFADAIMMAFVRDARKQNKG